MKLPLVTGEEMCKILGKLGFNMVHRKGSHTVWQHPDGRTTTVPIHPGQDLPRGLIRKILAHVDLSPSDYENMV